MSTRSRRKFTPEFKAEAVEMVEAAGGNIARVAKELGIYDSTLGNWVRQAREQAAGAPTVQERAEIRELRRELERTRREPGHPGKRGGLLLGVPEDQRVTAVYSFIAEEKADPTCAWSVAEMCRTLGVSRQGFYDWQSRPPSDHQVTDRLLAAEIEAIWECSARTYGAPRVHAWLRRQGYPVSRKRVARIMREHGWVGVSGRRRVRTTIVDPGARAAEDLVARNFNPAAPDVTWAGDITYIPTGEGWLFLATVIDLFSRRVIGWGVADHPRTPLVAGALEMAVATRGGHVDGVVFHSDRGCQYTSGENRQLCERLRVTQSMGATGICFDNSPAEAFFATLKRELVHRQRFATRAEARREIIRWIEGWYNARRLHSWIAYMSPNEKEAAWHTDRPAA